ncbi:MAG: DUF222 domain-containing protein [Microcella sp.]|nr:DUF222 domain-containing protein [Microcella sp.]
MFDELTAELSAGLASSRTDALLEALVECEVRASRIAARRVELVHELRVEQERIERERAERDRAERALGAPISIGADWDPGVIARRSASAELACALRVTSRTADSLLARAATLMTTLPVTMEALHDGRVAFAHAAVIADAADSLPAESRAEFERAILPSAEAQNPSRLKSRARVLRERMHPESIAARRDEAMATRDVFVDPVADGMAWLSALLPAEKAYGAYRRLTRIAESLEDGHDSRNAGLGPGSGPGADPGAERRTLGNRRADALADLLISGEVDASGLGLGMRAEVHVTVPVLTLLGRSGGAPATLEGYGPIDDDTARRLAATAPSFTRLLTHPETGVVLSVGRDRYRVPAELQTWLRVRDGTCRFPGCARSAARCDLDHTRDWQHGGATAHDNLAHLCRHHHRLKHQTGWTVAQEPGGILRWRAPSGRSYSSEPALALTG